MFKKGLEVLNKTKEAAKSSLQVEQVEEADHVSNAKASIKNLKWTMKLLLESAKNYYVSSNKQVETGGQFSNVLHSFSEKTSHTSYITNQTVPLSVALQEASEGVKNSQIYFQQYTQLFADKFSNQIQNLYTTHVKKLSQLVKQQEEVRFRYNQANSNLKSAQKSGATGTKLAEKQTEFENHKAHYDKVNETLEKSVNETVNFVQKEVAVALKQFVAEQQLLVQEGIKIWTQSENKIFGVESPLNNNNNNNQQLPVSLEKLSIDNDQYVPQPQQHQQQQQQQYQQEYQQPQQHNESTTSPNPFDEKNPFDTNL